MDATTTDAKLAALRAHIDQNTIGLFLGGHDLVESAWSDLVIFVRAGESSAALYDRDTAARMALARHSPGEIMSLRSSCPKNKVLVRVEDHEHYAYFYIEHPRATTAQEGIQ